jgi:hypothetical protein
MALRNALHVAIQSDQNRVIDVRNDANHWIGSSPGGRRPIEKSDLMSGHHESVAYGIGNAFV